MRNTLICTVGTSLFGNLKNLSENTLNKPNNWKEIKECYNPIQPQKLSHELLKILPTERICGAEINTIEEARKKKWLDIQNIISFMFCF